MGAAQSIPVVGEIVTVLDSGTRAIAAGVCEVVGDDKDAKELIKGAENSLKHYTDVNVIVANARVVYFKAKGDEKTVDDILGKEGEAWTEVGENTPGVGHVVALARYIGGDKEGAKRAFMAATRSALVVGAAVATGGAGGAAVAATFTGLAADGVMTGLNSLGEHKYAPVGTFAGVTRAMKSKSVNDWVSAAEIPAGDALAGAMEGGVKAALSRPKAFEMVETAVDQIPMETLRGNTETAHFVREFPDDVTAMKYLAAGGDNQYDFVRLTDGRIRAVSHTDSAAATRHIPNRGPVGHSSLVEPGHAVHAAGEIHLKGGVVTNINCQSGHYRVPLRFMERQMGDAFPRKMLTMESLVVARMFGAVTGRRAINVSLPGLREIAIYSPTLFVFGMTQNKEPATLHNAHYTVAFHEKDSVKMIGVADQSSAQAVYDDIPDEYPKALISKREAKVLSSHGDTTLVQQCKDEALGLKSFLVTHGFHLTVPLHDALYVVAFYRKDCVKMVGCPTEDFGRKVYKHIAPGLAKVLLDRRGGEVLDSTAGDSGSDKLTQCKDHAMKLPAFDETIHLECASWFLIWYQKDSVKAVGFRTKQAAEAAYDSISTEYAKILGEKGKTEPSKSNGDANRCKDALLILKNIHQAVPLENAPYVIASHVKDHVQIIGFTTKAAGDMFYYAGSKKWARILYDRRIPHILRESWGREEVWARRCEVPVSRLPALQETEIPCGQYLVVIHYKEPVHSDRKKEMHNEEVHMITLATEASARAVYDAIDPYWSRMLLNRERDETTVGDSNNLNILQKDGGGYYIQKCEEAIQGLIRLQTTVPLEAAQFLVAYRQGKRVWLIGFNKQADAQDAYDAISKDCPKVIANRGNTNPLATNGSETDVKECEDEIRRFFPLDDFTPHKAALESAERPSVNTNDNKPKEANPVAHSPVRTDNNNPKETDPSDNRPEVENSDDEPDVDANSDDEPDSNDEPDVEGNSDDEPDVEANSNGQPDIEDNSDDSEANTNDRSDVEGNSDDEPEVGDDEDDEPDTEDNNNDDPGVEGNSDDEPDDEADNNDESDVEVNDDNELDDEASNDDDPDVGDGDNNESDTKDGEDIDEPDDNNGESDVEDGKDDGSNIEDSDGEPNVEDGDNDVADIENGQDDESDVEDGSDNAPAEGDAIDDELGNGSDKEDRGEDESSDVDPSDDQPEGEEGEGDEAQDDEGEGENEPQEDESTGEEGEGDEDQEGDGEGENEGQDDEPEGEEGEGDGSQDGEPEGEGDEAQEGEPEGEEGEGDEAQEDEDEDEGENESQVDEPEGEEGEVDEAQDGEPEGDEGEGDEAQEDEPEGEEDGGEAQDEGEGDNDAQEGEPDGEGEGENESQEDEPEGEDGEGDEAQEDEGEGDDAQEYEPEGDEGEGDEAQDDESEGEEGEGDEAQEDEPEGEEGEGEEAQEDGPEGDEGEGDEAQEDEGEGANEAQEDEPEGEEGEGYEVQDDELEGDGGEGDEVQDDEPEGEEGEGYEAQEDEPEGDEDEAQDDDPEGEEGEGYEAQEDEPEGDEGEGGEAQEDEPEADEGEGDEAQGDEDNEENSQEYEEQYW